MPEEYVERFLRLRLIKTSTFDIKECITQKMTKDYQTLCTDASTIESQIFANIVYDTIYHNSKYDHYIDEKQLQKYLKNIVKNI
jgi:nitrogen fixation/metabolism regulation signal transduction histidine kinase